MVFTSRAKYALHMICPVRRLLIAPDPRDKFHQLREILGAEVALPVRQHDERIRRRQVCPCAWQRDHRAINLLAPDTITVPAGPLGDTHELLARQWMERVSDADPRHRRCRAGCS